MYTIEAAKWKDIEPFWAEWRTYDLVTPTPAVKENISRVWINLEDILRYDETKTFVFFSDEEPLGCLRVMNLSSTPLKVSGIGNVAVTQRLRGNGIGKRLMEVAEMYLLASGYPVVVLHPSEYTKQSGFYKGLGYIPYRNVLLKFFGGVTLSLDDLDKVIELTGKF